MTHALGIDRLSKLPALLDEMVEWAVATSLRFDGAAV